MRTLPVLLVVAVVAQASAGEFASKPTVSRAAGKVKIAFAAAEATDVEVAILDAKGKVVRHLAAGLLGRNAPEPLTKDALAQEIEWDLRDDAGKAVGDLSGLKVRVRLGVKPRLDGILGWDGNTFGGAIEALTVSPKGEIFMLLTDHFRGRAELRVLDREGKYRRTIMPYPADTPPARTESIGHVMIDGRRQPMVFNGQGHCFHPLTAGLRGQTMAWHPKGHLIVASAVGSMCDHGPPRHLIAFHPEGGAPEGVGFVGPKIRNPIGFIGGAGEGGSRGMDRLAVSPDGKWIYFVQNFSSKIFQKSGMKHGVYRLKWSHKKTGRLWLGKDKGGAGDDEFDDPQGIALDAAGRLYVCDCGNGRVKVYSPEGKLLGQFAAEDPQQIAVHAKSGEIFVLSKKNERRVKAGKLLRFSAFDGKTARKLAEQEVTGLACMALDPTAASPRLWIAYATGWRKAYGLSAVTVAGEGFKIGKDVCRRGLLHYPSFIAADPNRGRVIIYEHLNAQAVRGHRAIDLKSGQVSVLQTRGSDLALDAAGNMYMMDPYNRNSLSRYGPDLKPLPFAATGENKLRFQYRAYGPSMGLRGHCIAPNGDLYVRRSPNHACVSTVDVWSPDGKLTKAGLVAGAGSADCGIGVDNRGNVYLGTNLKPPGKPLPEDFAGAVPAGTWRYYRRLKRKPPWSYLYCNPYIFHMGSVLKFGPEGGTIYGNFADWARFTDPKLKLAKAPPGAVAYKSSYLRWDVKVVGAKWRYAGIGIVPSSFDAFRGDDGCSCMVTQLDADPYGRVYAPSVFRSCVEMLDPAGSRIARIGAYGNADSAGPKSKAPAPEIPFAWPTVCDYAEADGRLYVTDSVNRRVVVVRFDSAAEELRDIK